MAEDARRKGSEREGWRMSIDEMIAGMKAGDEEARSAVVD